MNNNYGQPIRQDHHGMSRLPFGTQINTKKPTKWNIGYYDQSNGNYGVAEIKIVSLSKVKFYLIIY